MYKELTKDVTLCSDYVIDVDADGILASHDIKTIEMCERYKIPYLITQQAIQEYQVIQLLLSIYN